jgi:hypothetical protein
MTTRTTSKQHTVGVTKRRDQPEWMTNGRSVSHSCRLPKITVIFICDVLTVCRQSAVTKRSGFCFSVAPSGRRRTRGFGTPFGRFFSRVLTESCLLKILQQLYSENTHKSAIKYAQMHGVHSREGWPMALLRTCDPLTLPICAPVSLGHVLKRSWLPWQVQFYLQSFPSFVVPTLCRSPISCVESLSHSLAELFQLSQGLPLFGVRTVVANFSLRSSCGIDC